MRVDINPGPPMEPAHLPIRPDNAMLKFNKAIAKPLLHGVHTGFEIIGMHNLFEKTGIGHEHLCWITKDFGKPGTRKEKPTIRDRNRHDRILHLIEDALE
nr:hypothetical protein [Candidatus Chloroploca sp. Khr17]